MDFIGGLAISLAHNDHSFAILLYLNKVKWKVMDSAHEPGNVSITTGIPLILAT